MANWSQPLSRSVGYTKPNKGQLLTLRDAAIYILDVEGARARRPQWQHAGKLILAAAEGGDIEAATRQLELALMMDGALDMGR